MKIAVLVSGSGTNLQALMDAISADPSFGGEIVLVLSDRAETGGVVRAVTAGIPVVEVLWTDFSGRETFTAAIVTELQRAGVELVVLAGFMRILSASAVAAFPNQILNVHPSLLPQFPGGTAVEDALASGVKVGGLTVHFVDEEVDHGPIIAQREVPITAEDSRDDLHVRIQVEEHGLYPKVVRAFCRGEISVNGTIVSLKEPL